MATITEVSRALNVTPQRVVQLTHLGMAKVRRGEYQLDLCLRWYILHLQKALKAKHDPERRSDAAAFVRERTRLAKEQADATRMRVQQMRGDLVHQATVAREFAAAVSAIVTYAKTLPAALAAECEGQDVTERQITLARGMADLLEFGVVWRPTGARGPE
jgi:terminase small subunit / prophage DNA-packing protein